MTEETNSTFETQADAALETATAAASSIPTPTLTLDPFSSTASAVQTAAAKPVDAPESALDESSLTEEEKRIVDDFAKKIDLTDTGLVLQYGAGAQQKMADFSAGALENVRTKDLGEVGNLLTSVVTELKGFNEEDEKGFLGLFKKGKAKVSTMKAKYDKAEVNINKITGELEKHQVRLMKDSATMDKMYEENLTYFKELTMYIIAGKKRLAEARSTTLVELTEKAQKSGLAEDAQAARDYESMCTRFEKKLHDLELTRMISIQTAPQIRLVQQNDTEMIEKIQSTIVNTIPLWKSQMVIALGVEHAAEAAKAQQQVTDLTNKLLQSNAQQLQTATIQTAKESERGIVDIETLTKTNDSLIKTLDEVIRIQEEGKQKRAAAEQEMNRLEAELKSKLLEIRAEKK